MQPAFSVIFLTTLIGAAQGLFLALYAAELAGAPSPLLARGAAVSVVLCGLGLIASFFHLGRPERAWRTATCWRSSWLSREVIALPLYMAGVFFWGVSHALGWGGTVGLGAVVVALCLALFVCTAMIYASVRFLQEWASPLTLINYLVLGCASGATLAAAFVSVHGSDYLRGLLPAAVILTLLGLFTRAASLVRNARLKPRSTLQSAIGIKHPHITQRAQGFMGGSFNTREFFHGKTPGALRSVKWFFLLTAFVLPLGLLSMGGGASGALILAFVIQFIGLLAERWFFFAQANHPQNLYYQTVS